MPLLRIASRCEDAELLRHAIFHPAFREYHLGPAARHWPLGQATETAPRFTFAELSQGASLTVAGQMLFRAGQDDELRLWGKAITAAAMAQVQATPPSTGTRVRIETRVEPDGELEGFGTDYLPDGGQNWHGISSGVWGVDGQSSRPAPTEADYERVCQELHEAMEARRATRRREIAEFNAVGALWRWSDLEPEAFTAFAMDFLPRVAAGVWTTRQDFGFFADAVLIALLRLNPAAALRLHSVEGGVCQGSVTTICRSLEWTTAALWERGLNASTEVRAARRERLLRAPHDEALLWHSLAAQRAGNARELAALAAGFLSSTAARERALGVTLLAFQGDETSHETLRQLEEHDASFWVREHARWAAEVCATESACRTRYREVVAAESLEILAAGLAEMRMALSPLAHAWRGEIERAAPQLTQDRRRHAYLRLFWYHWGNTSSRQKDIKLVGRELQKFCCGERLNDGVTSRMAPWWTLE
jgi:hypothetical protein